MIDVFEFPARTKTYIQIEQIVKQGVDVLFSLPQESNVDPYFHIENNLKSKLSLSQNTSSYFSRAIVWYCIDNNLLEFNILTNSKFNAEEKRWVENRSYNTKLKQDDNWIITKKIILKYEDYLRANLDHPS